MPNFCSNYIILKANPETIKKIEKALEEGNLFNTFVPEPEGIRENDPTGEKLISWRYANWNTKWEASEIQLIMCTDNTLTATFETAWNPPTLVYNELMKHVDSLTVYYMEYGNEIYGMYEDGQENYYEIDTVPDEFWDYFDKPEFDDEDECDCDDCNDGNPENCENKDKSNEIVCE